MAKKKRTMDRLSLVATAAPRTFLDRNPGMVGELVLGAEIVADGSHICIEKLGGHVPRSAFSKEDLHEMIDAGELDMRTVTIYRLSPTGMAKARQIHREIVKRKSNR